MVSATKDKVLAEVNGEAQAEEGPAPLPRLTFEQIMQAADVGEREVSIPAWGGSLLMRTLRSHEVEAVRAAHTRKDRFGNDYVDQKPYMRAFICATLVEPKLTPDQVEAMEKARSAYAMSELYKQVLRINGQSEEAVQDATKSPGHAEEAPEAEV